MRLVTYTFRGTTRLGALAGDAEVVDLNRACALHRAERGERRERVADLAQRLHHGGMGRGVEPGQSEGRSDGAEGAVDSCSVHGHGVSA